MYSTLFDRLLTKTDAETAHNITSRAIRFAGRGPVAPLVSRILGTQRREVGRYFGRGVPSRLGIAAGFDKNARMAAGLAAMGFGFVEVGTVTAHGQVGNDRPRLFRVLPERAIRNRMGFNNDGADRVAVRLAKLRRTPAGRRLLLGVNIGKSKITPSAQAVADYVYSAKKLAPFADYLVVNVSSPNTPGLRDLQAITSLEPIVTGVQTAANHAAARAVPVLVKIAPDLADDDIAAVAEVVNGSGLAGVVAVNTTIGHDHGPGGLSGPSLKPRGVEVVRLLRDTLHPDKVIIGVGGISAPADTKEYLSAGADLVQAYTGFIYGGPRWPVEAGRV